MRQLSLSAMMLILAGLLPNYAAAGPALLFDASSGQVLYAEDQDDYWHPASLTKIMTAYLTFEALREGKVTLSTKIPCTEAANLQPPSKLGLPVGGEITLEHALQALIIKSANDVAMMLAEAIGGNEQAFVEKMNATAERLGMTRTRFVNPNGLPAPEQVTTARDLAKLSRAVLKDFPEHAHYWSMGEMRLGKLRIRTHNGLLNTFDGADGLKTGFICDSGFNIVASATRDGRRLMAVVLGEPSGAERTVRAASLLEHGFQHYGWKNLFNTQSIDNLPVPTDAKGITSMRESVVSWDCGTGRPRQRPALKAFQARKAAKAKSRAQTTAKKSSSAQAEKSDGGQGAQPDAPAQTKAQ